MGCQVSVWSTIISRAPGNKSRREAVSLVGIRLVINLPRVTQ
jgi:hypothetical protein